MTKKPKTTGRKFTFGTDKMQAELEVDAAIMRDHEENEALATAERRPPRVKKTRKAIPTVGRSHKLPIISKGAVELCINTLRGMGINSSKGRNAEALFAILGQVLNTKGGTEIWYSADFLTNPVGKIKKALTEAHLIYCQNPHVYKTRYFGKGFHKRQKYLPMPLLCGVKYRGGMLKASLSAYEKANYQPTPLSQCSEVEQSKESGIEIPKNIVEACGKGTNLRFDFEEAQKTDLGKRLSTEKVWDIYANLIVTTGCLPDEINPKLWKQSKKTGAISAQGPALQNLSSMMFHFLRSCDDRPLRTIDFSNYHLVLWQGEDVARRIKAGYDYYGAWVKEISIGGMHPARWEVKRAVSALLNGQTTYPLIKRDPKKPLSVAEIRFLKIFQSLVKVLSKQFPKQVQNCPNPLIRRKPENYWNKLGTKIFYKCLSAGMTAIGAKKIGLPKYDGITFAATDEELERFLGAWTAASEGFLGFKLPSKSSPDLLKRA